MPLLPFLITEAMRDNSVYPTKSVIGGELTKSTVIQFASDVKKHTKTTQSGNVQVVFKDKVYTGYAGADIITQDANKNAQSKYNVNISPDAKPNVEIFSSHGKLLKVAHTKACEALKCGVNDLKAVQLNVTHQGDDASMTFGPHTDTTEQNPTWDFTQSILLSQSDDTYQPKLVIPGKKASNYNGVASFLLFPGLLNHAVDPKVAGGTVKVIITYSLAEKYQVDGGKKRVMGGQGR
jgi:hypothetical protein